MIHFACRIFFHNTYCSVMVCTCYGIKYRFITPTVKHSCAFFHYILSVFSS